MAFPATTTTSTVRGDSDAMSPCVSDLVSSGFCSVLFNPPSNFLFTTGHALVFTTLNKLMHLHEKHSLYQRTKSPFTYSRQQTRLRAFPTILVGAASLFRLLIF
jgi:hypothetical protein